ncbi:MAG: hypothetical protein FD152_4550 [Xanthobacteraceae bacterium]|nr:MAG: hypothetical protein FD152_4550 [Xanthobacteraceae bacterium]
MEWRPGREMAWCDAFALAKVGMARLYASPTGSNPSHGGSPRPAPEGFEKKFAHDEELRFKATARRNKLLGLWVAEKLGKTGADADAYAKSVVMSDFEEAGDDDVFRKVKADLDAANAGQSDHQIRRTMDELMATAIAQVQAG